MLYLTERFTNDSVDGIGSDPATGRKSLGPPAWWFLKYFKVSVFEHDTRALLEAAGWLDLEEVSVRLRLFESQKVPELRYTTCPPCAQEMRDSLGNENAA